jgi:hypothetical protein
MVFPASAALAAALKLAVAPAASGTAAGVQLAAVPQFQLLVPVYVPLTCAGEFDAKAQPSSAQIHARFNDRSEAEPRDKDAQRSRSFFGLKGADAETKSFSKNPGETLFLASCFAGEFEAACNCRFCSRVLALMLLGGF